MKAHPDLKYNKVSAPQVRSSLARLSFLARPTKLSLEMTSSPIVPGKLADESQMGSLSCLLTSPPLTPTSVSVNSIGTSTFVTQPEHYTARTSTSPLNAQKPTSPTIPKPPKKRYLLENSYSTLHSTSVVVKNDISSPVSNYTPTWNMDEITSDKLAANQLSVLPYLYSSQNVYREDADTHKTIWNNKFHVNESVPNDKALDCSKSLLNHRSSVDVACQVVSEYINSFSGVPDVNSKNSLESSFSHVDNTDVAINLSNHNFETIKVSQQQIIEKAIDKFCGPGTENYPTIKNVPPNTYIPTVPESLITSVPGECNNNILATNLTQLKFMPSTVSSADSFNTMNTDSKVLNVTTSIEQLPESGKIKNVSTFPLSQSVSSVSIINYCDEELKPVKLFSYQGNTDTTPNKESITVNKQCVLESKSHVKNEVPLNYSESGHGSISHLNDSKEKGSEKEFMKKRFIKKFKNGDSCFPWNTNANNNVNCELSSVIFGSKDKEDCASIANINMEKNAVNVSSDSSTANVINEICEQDNVKECKGVTKVGFKSEDNDLRTDYQETCASTFLSPCTDDIKTENISGPYKLSQNVGENSFKSIKNEKDIMDTEQYYSRATGSSKRKISVKRAQMMKQESMITSVSDAKTENTAHTLHVSSHTSKLSAEHDHDNPIINSEYSKIPVQKLQKSVQSKNEEKSRKRPRTKAPVELPAPREATIRACKGMKYREFMHGISSGRRSKKSLQTSLLVQQNAVTSKEKSGPEVSLNNSGPSVKSTASASDSTAQTSSNGSSVSLSTKEKPTALMTISFILAAAAEESSFFSAAEDPATQLRTRLNSLESRSSERTDSAAESDDSSSLKIESSSHSTQNISNKRKTSSEVLPPVDFEDFHIKKICSTNSEKRLSIESDSSKSSQDTPSSSPSSSSHGFSHESSSNQRIGSQKRKRLKHNVKKNASNNRDTSVVSPELLTDIALDTLATVAVAETRMHSDDEAMKPCKLTDKSQSFESSSS